MSSLDLGKVCATPVGAWDSSNAYEFLDIVTKEGSSYIALANVPIGTPITDGSYWQLLAQKGDQGIQGIQGIQGERGLTGDQGEKGDDGNGISDIRNTSTLGLTDTYTIYYDNGRTSTFNVTNGAKGDPGEKGDTGAKGDTGDVNFCTFAINPETGILSAVYDTAMANLTFNINSDGIMEVSIS